MNRVGIAVPTDANAVAVGDELIVHGQAGSNLRGQVVELEQGLDQDRSATVMIKAGESPGPRLVLLHSQPMKVGWILPAWFSWLATSVEPVSAVLLAIGVLFATVKLLSRIWLPTGRHEKLTQTRRFARSMGSARLRAFALTVLGISIATGGVASALFTGNDAVVANQFSTGCFDAEVSQVQQGQAASSAEGTQAIAITTVDPARSLVLISVRSGSSRPADSMVMAQLASPTQLELVRRTDDPTPPIINVEWTIIEYGCGVTVQRGSTFGNAATDLDVSVTAVDPAASFVVTSSVTDRADAAHDGDDDHLASLLDGTTLRISAAAGAVLPNDHSYAWQVVTYDDPGDVLVQTTTQTLSGTNSETVTLASAVDPASTLVLANAASAGSGNDIGERLARVHLSSATTVEVTRLLAGDPLEVSLQIITFTDGTLIQHGVLNLSIGESVGTVGVNPIDTSRASALSTVAGPGSFSGGAASMASAAVLGEASATFAVTDPTTVTVTRDATTAAASFGWQLVEWGGPSWWDTDYPFRQRIDVSTSSTSAPGAYTVPVTIDHQGLVGAGLAQSNGDDLRVLRWDGASWTELDRVLDDDAAWNSATTTFWFRTTDAIGVSETDTYWMYYGDGTPAAPLADPEGVWLLHEDFETGTLGDFEDRTGGTAWYRALPWPSRIPLSIQSSQLDATLNNFPVYVELTNGSLGTGAQADGSDIRFTAADGVTPLAHEIESWSPGTGALSAWISIPEVSASVDTAFFLHFGAADAPSQDNRRGVWRNASGIWHLSRDPAGAAPQADDSSNARHDGLSAGAMSSADLVTGLTGSALNHDGVDDRLDIEPFDIAGKTVTVSGWVRLDATTGDQQVFAKANDATDRILTLGTSGTQANFELRLGATTQVVAGGVLGTGVWHHLAGTWNGSTMSLYVDGVSVATNPASGNLHRDAAMPVSLGDSANGDRPLDGLVDEVRIETTVRSSDWLLASVRNQSTPSTFVIAGATSGGTWFDQGDWLYRKPLTVNADNVGSNLTDQPVLVQFVDPELAGKLQADGDDVVFTGGDGVTRLDHQLEAVNAGTGAVTAWVRLSLLDAANDTPLFVYYGNTTAVDQSDEEGVFGPDADLVFHGS